MIDDIEENWEENKIKGKKDYYFLEDCFPGLRFTVLIEKNQNLFWLEVIHTDFSGDGPECKKR